jgi:hypothetical protein
MAVPPCRSPRSRRLSHSAVETVPPSVVSDVEKNRPWAMVGARSFRSASRGRTRNPPRVRLRLSSAAHVVRRSASTCCPCLGARILDSQVRGRFDAHIHASTFRRSSHGCPQSDLIAHRGCCRTGGTAPASSVSLGANGLVTDPVRRRRVNRIPSRAMAWVRRGPEQG